MLGSHVAVRLWSIVPEVSVPSYMLIVTVPTSPLRTPAVPLNAGVWSLVNPDVPIADSVTTGAVTSTLKVEVALVPVLPAESDCSAWAV